MPKRSPRAWLTVVALACVGCNGAGPSDAAAPSAPADGGNAMRPAVEEQPVRMRCRFDDHVDAPTEMRYDSRTVCLSRIRCWDYRAGSGDGLISADGRTFVVGNPEASGMTVTMNFDAVDAVVRVERDGGTQVYQGDCTLY